MATFPEGTSDAEKSRWVNALANLGLLADASPKTVERLVQEAAFTKKRPGELICHALEPAKTVFFLLEGTARAYQEDGKGSEYTPKLFVAPSHFGELAALGGLSQYRSSVRTLTEVVVAAVPIPTLEHSLRADSALCLSWLYSVARQHSVTIDFARQHVFGNVASRLANVLLSYGDVFGVKEGGWQAIDFRLSYADLARQAACTRRAAISALQQLIDQGLVRQSAGGWLIDPARILEDLLPGRLGLLHSLRDNRPPDGGKE